MSILKKLTVRNAMALSTVGVFLYGIVYGIHNIETVSKAVESSSLLSAFIGSFLTLVPIVYYFYFRKPQSKPEVN